MNMHFTEYEELHSNVVQRPPTWTDERVELLISLWTDGHSASIIAGKLGKPVTRNAVIGKVHRMGLAGRRVEVRMPYRVGDRPSWSIERHEREAKRRASMPKQPRRPSPPRVRPPKPIPEPAFALDPRDMGLGAWDALADSRPVSLVELEAGMCRWPVGADSPYLFCGCQVIPGKSYCGTHVERARSKFVQADRDTHLAAKRKESGTEGRWA
jgi:GcrA cell cycle regulator